MLTDFIDGKFYNKVDTDTGIHKRFRLHLSVRLTPYIMRHFILSNNLYIYIGFEIHLYTNKMRFRLLLSSICLYPVLEASQTSLLQHRANGMISKWDLNRGVDQRYYCRNSFEVSLQIVMFLI